MIQLYFETTRDGLVPVEFMDWATRNMVRVKVTENTLCYKKGESIEASPLNIVTKAPDKGIDQMVRQAALPQAGRPK